MKGRITAAVVTALVLLTSGGSLARAASDGPSVLVRFAAQATASQRALALQAIGATVDGTIGVLGVTRVRAAAGLDADSAAAILAAEPGVSQAEPDRSLHLALNEIHIEIFKRELSAAALFAAKQSPNPRQQLIKFKGFGQIVIGPRIQAAHFVACRIQSRQHEHETLETFVA